MSGDAAWLAAPDAGVRYPKPTADADEFVGAMEAAHRVADTVDVPAAMLTSADARKLAERLIAEADRMDGKHFEFVNKDDEWDPQP